MPLWCLTRMIRRFTFTSPRWRTPADVCLRRYERNAMIKGFKEFIAQGNALELAVAVIIGAAFKPIVDAITKVIMTIIGQLIGQPNFDSLGHSRCTRTAVTPSTWPLLRSLPPTLTAS